ncbi:helix-turn-helix transcriptional regulator [Streptomyces sp. NPDC001508]|uniref:helix-turn-helix transcriptional regulator n=1 Tax=Streptomyces sp. NPDC001508 TaxID=3154656 RepID=UPI003325DC7A
MRRTRSRKRKATWMRLRNPDAIKRRRKRMRYTQRDLGALVGCSHTMIGLLETGKIKTCTHKLAERICNRLDMDLDDTFEVPQAVSMPKMSSVQPNTTATA